VTKQKLFIVLGAGVAAIAALVVVLLVTTSSPTPDQKLIDDVKAASNNFPIRDRDVLAAVKVMCSNRAIVDQKTTGRLQFVYEVVPAYGEWPQSSKIALQNASEDWYCAGH
jgi:hypothetical protein